MNPDILEQAFEAWAVRYRPAGLSEVEKYEWNMTRPLFPFRGAIMRRDVAVDRSVQPNRVRITYVCVKPPRAVEAQAAPQAALPAAILPRHAVEEQGAVRIIDVSRYGWGPRHRFGARVAANQRRRGVRLVTNPFAIGLAAAGITASAAIAGCAGNDTHDEPDTPVLVDNQQTWADIYPFPILDGQTRQIVMPAYKQNGVDVAEQTGWLYGEGRGWVPPNQDPDTLSQEWIEHQREKERKRAAAAGNTAVASAAPPPPATDPSTNDVAGNYPPAPRSPEPSEGALPGEGIVTAPAVSSAAGSTSIYASGGYQGQPGPQPVPPPPAALPAQRAAVPASPSSLPAAQASLPQTAPQAYVRPVDNPVVVMPYGTSPAMPAGQAIQQPPEPRRAPPPAPPAPPPIPVSAVPADGYRWNGDNATLWHTSYMPGGYSLSGGQLMFLRNFAQAATAAGNEHVIYVCAYDNGGGAAPRGLDDPRAAAVAGSLQAYGVARMYIRPCDTSVLAKGERRDSHAHTDLHIGGIAQALTFRGLDHVSDTAIALVKGTRTSGEVRILASGLPDTAANLAGIAQRDLQGALGPGFKVSGAGPVLPAPDSSVVAEIN